jgi:hypothetical protein
MQKITNFTQKKMPLWLEKKEKIERIIFLKNYILNFNIDLIPSR